MVFATKHCDHMLGHLSLLAFRQTRPNGGEERTPDVMRRLRIQKQDSLDGTDEIGGGDVGRESGGASGKRNV